MFRTVLATMVIAAMVGMLLGVLLPVAAQESPSATRSLSPSSVAPGGEVTVTITVANYGGFGSVTETLPHGFVYQASSLDDVQVQVDGQEVRFTLQGDTSFTYILTASSMAGVHPISGQLRDSDRVNHPVGVSSVTVEAAPEPPPAPPTPAGPSATRSFSPTTVAPGGQVMVTITVANYGGFGKVTETLPDGFVYQASSLDDVQVQVDGQEVRFTLQGDTSFTYILTASSMAGVHPISGQLRDSDRVNHPVGVSSVTVEAPVGPGSRSFSRSQVTPGGEVTVTITLADYGGFGKVTETLPDGFVYHSSSLDDVQVQVDGREVRFTLQGDTSFTYIVTASRSTASHAFSGVLIDSDRNETSIGGAASVTVRAPSPPRPRPPANNPPTFASDPVIYTIAENSPPGTNVGEPVTATDPDGDTLTYTLGGADVADFRIDSASGQITVGPDTSLDYETKPMYDDLAVMASDGKGGSATTDVIINLTDVDEAPPADPCVNDLGRDGARGRDLGCRLRLGEPAGPLRQLLQLHPGGGNGGDH